MVVEGVAAPYNKTSLPLGGGRSKFIEKFAARSLYTRDDQDYFLLFMHDPRQVLCRSGNGGIKLIDADNGMMMKAVMPNTTLGRDCYEMIKNGTIRGLSVGMAVEGDEWSEISTGSDDGATMMQRTITKARVGEVSLTPMPAYPDTNVSIRDYESMWEEYAKKLVAEKAAKEPPSPPKTFPVPDENFLQRLRKI